MCRLRWENSSSSWVSVMGRLGLAALQLPGSFPALQHATGLCLNFPNTPSHILWAQECFLAWVASWQLPRHGLSASVHPLSPAAGLDSAGWVLICVNGAEKSCSPSTSHPQLNRLRQRRQGLWEAGLRYGPNGGRVIVKVSKWRKVSSCFSLSWQLSVGLGGSLTC